ncbi:MAG TPA: response regulator [Methylomirabilota bacterium]|nr:response regulator [Methylomirabilota bacterium]
MTPREAIRVLLVEDDEDDYVLTTSLFSEIRDAAFQVEWLKHFSPALEAMAANRHDVCLIDYRLGAQTGLDLLRAALERGCKAPIILLTGQGEQEVDIAAIKAGAADYLIKGRLDSGLLGRSIRYAIERQHAAERARAEQARLAAFGADVGLTLTRRDSLDSILLRCAAALNRYLHGALAGIWTHDPEDRTLKLRALSCSGGSAALTTATEPRVNWDLQQLAAGHPLLIPQVVGDARVPDQDWVKAEGIVSYAGYPLRLEDRLVGLMSLFARTRLTEATIQEMASVANGIALCIERKRADEARDASEFKYRSVVENVKEVIFQMDATGRWTFLNPAWTETTGFAVRDSIGRHFLEFIHPEDREQHCEVIKEILKREKSDTRDETRYLTRNGSFRWVEVYIQPILSPGDGPGGASGTLRDITERKYAEAEIRKLAAFPRFNPNPVMELDADGLLTYLNDAARRMAETLGATDPRTLLPPQVTDIVRRGLGGDPSPPPPVQVTLGGRTLSWSFFPIPSSQVVHCYGTDITERLSLEAQLRQSQKMESIGQLAAGVAHDFNNILTIIQGHTDRLLAQPGLSGAVLEPLRQVAEAARRASTLTRQLLMFSRKQVMQPRVLEINGILANMTKMLQRLLGDDVALDAQLPAGLPPIEADAGMIEQVVMNLAVNARDAMSKGGRLTLATRETIIDTSSPRSHADARPGRFVCLSVTDTGCGMSPATLERIFEPFFTTKEVGKGTGLGLATVYGIVKQHQGWIEVQSRPEHGTTFHIFLPATDKPVEAATERGPSAQPVSGGQETILLVEDEPVLRELARLILGDYHYRVLEAGTGHEAIRVFEEHGGAIDLLLTDMVMPEGMTGRELADTLRARRPQLKVIFTSGYSADVMGGEGDRDDIRFLQKPYPPPLLARTVRECLDM